MTKDKFEHFTALSHEYQENTHYRIEWEDRSRKILILAPHGGGIEPGTSELARAIAGKCFSLYTFEGLLKTHNKDLHITSHHFDEPGAVELARKSEMVLAIHGCKGPKPMIHIGGTHVELKERLFNILKDQGYPVIVPVRGKFAARISTNICNQSRTGQGVQLEFSTGIRRQMFQSLCSRGRGVTKPFFHEFVQSIQEALE